MDFLLQARSTNFYISDRNSGRRFYVRTGEGGAKMTWMIKKNTVSFDGGDSKGAPRRSLENWAASHGLSCAGAVRVEEGYVRLGPPDKRSSTAPGFFSFAVELLRNHISIL